MKGDAAPEPAASAPRWVGDLSGAFADLGTFLPLIIGMFAVQRLDPVGLLVGFGLFAWATALIYRRPVPVQPMKVVAALVIAGGLTATEVAATGILLGVILCVLAAVGAVGRLGRHIPQTVLSGIQLGVGLYLAWFGIKLVIAEPLIGGIAIAALLLLQGTRFRPLAALLVVVGAAVWGGLRAGAAFPDLSLSLSLPQLQLPDLQGFWVSSRDVLLPQLALTLTNATVITAAIAADLFPQERARITSDRLAWSSGALNLLLAPFGAFPMCHGAGGLVVQHRFGARSGLAPAVFGSGCLALGLLLGPNALPLLELLPLAAVGSLLLIAGADLALTRRLRRAAPDQLVVIVLTGAACVVLNIALGLLAGFVFEGLRVLVARRRGRA
ncbi:MAG: putative sulfate/molybdate transporter [Gammaproteobacteria bacterium]|nr:putative sulfate/molybdate transporter [Gammaproteobacteria bacterium]MCP5318506.1 sulfate transporter [Chromatiaceae bacterium]MCW5586996.1 putative sulfate/molybdate transporter [Chromatiales bacterium]MCB1818482.1 putative sulfate/molybdate transporter [Gammaproteobacteria bacterium]MCP5431541.1 sulfate transporter [Chromatiaceae bacterium]